MNHLSLICVGKEYIDIFSKKINTIAHEEYANIHILTSNLSEVRKISMSTMFHEKILLYYLDEKNFNYFNKFYFTLELAIKLKTTIKYVDIKRTEFLSKFNYNTDKKGIHYLAPWGPNLLTASSLKDYGCDYFEKGYWNAFLEKLKSNNVDTDQIIPITEQLLVVNFSDKLQQLIEVLKEVELDFIKYSTTMESVYRKPANGEGLALGYAVNKLNIPIHLLKRQTSYLI